LAGPSSLEKLINPRQLPAITVRHGALSSSPLDGRYFSYHQDACRFFYPLYSLGSWHAYLLSLHPSHSRSVFEDVYCYIYTDPPLPLAPACIPRPVPFVIKICDYCIRGNGLATNMMFINSFCSNLFPSNYQLLYVRNRKRRCYFLGRLC
jgi:hypothetical protein